MSDSGQADPRPVARRKLGKGLGALLGEARREEPFTRPPLSPVASDQGQDSTSMSREPATGGLASLPVASIEPHPEQPRRHFDEDSLNELAGSIAARGVIQPVIVRPLGGSRYQLVAGERRWRAAQKAQLHEIPALIRDLEDRDVLALALIENIQREDLNAVEEARAYALLAEREALTQAEIARLVEKSRSHVANMQRLLTLPEEVLDHLAAGRLDMGHARALVGREDARELAQRAVDQSLSVREVERMVRRASRAEAPPGGSRPPEKDADIAAVENHLEEFLGLQVQIRTDADPRSGSVSIRYRTLDQLDLICQRLTGGGI